MPINSITGDEMTPDSLIARIAALPAGLRESVVDLMQAYAESSVVVILEMIRDGMSPALAVRAATSVESRQEMKRALLQSAQEYIEQSKITVRLVAVPDEALDTMFGLKED